MYAFWLGCAILCMKKLFQQPFVYVERCQKCVSGSVVKRKIMLL